MFEEIRHEDDTDHFRYVEPTSDRLHTLMVTASWSQTPLGGWSVLRRWPLHWRLCLDSGNGTSRMSPGDPAGLVVKIDWSDVCGASTDENDYVQPQVLRSQTLFSDGVLIGDRQGL